MDEWGRVCRIEDMDDFSPAYKNACVVLRDRMVDYCRSHPDVIAENIQDAELFMAFVDFDASDIAPTLGMLDAAWESALEVLRAEPLPLLE